MQQQLRREASTLQAEIYSRAVGTSGCSLQPVVLPVACRLSHDGGDGVVMLYAVVSRATGLRPW